LASPVPVTSTKRLRASGDTATTLPVDLLLEIAFRSDAVTILRCAAVSKLVRASILDPGFRRRLTFRGFDPSLLRGISYKLEAGGVVRVFQTLPLSSEPIPVRSKPASLCCFEPVAWRDGIAVFRHNSYSCGQDHDDVVVDSRRSPTERLTVCNSITGHTVSLPPVAVRENYYPPALLAVDDNFELLVADKDLGTRVYSSRDGGWSAARAAHHAVHPPPRPLRDRNKHPVVIGRTVHWLCVPGWCHNLGKAHALQIVALDVDTAQATVMELPQGCISRMNGFKSNNAITLAVSADGARLLSLIVSETQVISMWSLSVDGGWSRQVLMDRQHWGVHRSVRFEGFGERSGTLLFHMTHVGLVHFNLATKQEAQALCMSDDPTTTKISHVRLHEINLAWMLRAMKPFV
jgi:hypothetical protein